MKALNLNIFCHAAFHRAAPRSAPLCCCRAAPCHATPCRCCATPCRGRAPLLPCHPLLYHPPLSCHATVSHVALRLSCAGWLLHRLVSRLLQHLSRAGWLLSRRLSHRIATSLIGPLPLSSRRPSLVALSLLYCAMPLSLRLSCASDLTSAPAALVYC
jgi:hypothetical protein